jgi:hypothetical protein
VLINLAKWALEKAGWPTEIATGRYMFPLGANLRNVAFAEAESKSKMQSALPEALNVPGSKPRAESL